MDFLSDRITAIRNGQQVGLRHIIYNLPTNNFSFSNQEKTNYLIIKSLEVLRREGYIRGFSFVAFQNKVSTHQQKNFNIFLKYDAFGNKLIQSIVRVSKPGRRVYLSTIALWQPQSTSGIFILSTSRGIITDVEARRYNVGGEVLFGVN